jgi:hypothetical protein
MTPARPPSMSRRSSRRESLFAPIMILSSHLVGTIRRSRNHLAAAMPHSHTAATGRGTIVAIPYLPAAGIRCHTRHTCPSRSAISVARRQSLSKHLFWLAHRQDMPCPSQRQAALQQCGRVEHRFCRDSIPQEAACNRRVLLSRCFRLLSLREGLEARFWLREAQGYRHHSCHSARLELRDIGRDNKHSPRIDSTNGSRTPKCNRLDNGCQ